MTGVLALTVGALTGLGTAALVWWWAPLTPDLAVARQRRLALAQPRAARSVSSRTAPSRTEPWSGLLADLADQLGVGRHAADLDLLDESATALAARKTGYALLGLMFPPILAAAMALLGLRLPLALPVATAFLLALLLFLIPDLDVRRRAAVARADLQRALCVYLELVALERAGDAGVGEALERAAGVGDSRLFVLLREELVRAQLAGEPAWSGIEHLARRVGLPALHDLADMMSLTGQDGAAVYSTLRARAASLRSAVLTAAAARANAASEQMVVPVALLGVAFLLLLGYPALARIVFG